ncbi:prolipoprotein diacylglyceryl transferase [Candidatus Woesearchaeota archaeon]|nr:MAG: prolipoprotein diacylglyceryl transferase [Candidatus Woesearchaeota archaeon]
MFNHNIDPVLFHLGPLEIRYYGIIYALGFIIAYFFLKRMVAEQKINLTKDDVGDLIFWIAVGVVIGARFFHVFVYNAGYYLKNPAEIIMVWHGGLSFHGGLVGAIIAAWVFCRKKKVSLLEIADIIVIPAALALSLGRIANFINAEIVGKVTDLPWCVNFPGYEGCRHPSQIYEAFKNFFIFLVLWSIRNLKLAKGSVFSIFLILYGLLRTLAEFVKDQPIIFAKLTMGQLLSIPMFFLGLFLLLHFNKIELKIGRVKIKF